MEERLEQLGDPSGQQSSAYWNEWFSVVGSERSSFEWYCDAMEVERVLDYHLSSFDNNTHGEPSHFGRRHNMIHPGAGNSLVPHKLRTKFPLYDHVVVDISPVALNMAEESLKSDENDKSGKPSLSTMTFLVGDVLQPPLHPTLKPDSFDAWIDKGLIDALFDKEHIEENQGHCATLFREAHRLLTPNAGFVFIVTLAEPHTLELILQNWSDGWSPTLHVWELVPISGKMRPFGFVLAKDDYVVTNKKVVIHHLKGGALATNVQVVEGMTASTMTSTITAVLKESRRQCREQEAQQQLQKEVTSSPYRLLATIDVKPCDDDVDLLGVCHQITTRSYAGIGPIQWVAWNDASNDDDAEKPVLAYPTTAASASYAKLVPMAFGLSKLVLRCLVSSSDELEAVMEDVLDWHAANGGDCIQSIDIDWEATCPVGSVKP